MDLSKTNRGELYDALNALVNELLMPGKKDGKAMIEAQRILDRVKGSEPRIDRVKHAATMSSIKAVSSELDKENQVEEDQPIKIAEKKGQKAE